MNGEFRIRALGLLLSILVSGPMCAQQPQFQPGTAGTTGSNTFRTNAAWVNGVGIGYWATKGSGLTLNIGAGTAFCPARTKISYAGGTLSMTDNTTNYVFLDTASSCAPAKNTTGFTSATLPIAEVVTSGGAITAITDDRTMFFQGGSGGGGVNAQTTNYTADATDNGKLITFNSAGNVTLTLPASPPSATWQIAAQDIGAGTLTVDRNGLTIDGAAANLTVVQTQGVQIYTDGSNYFTLRATLANALYAQGSNQSITITPSGSGYTVLNGKVGIGTSSPAKRLDVRDSARIGSYNGDADILIGASGYAGSVQGVRIGRWASDDVTFSTILYIGSNSGGVGANRVGIGTDSPTSVLTIGFGGDATVRTSIDYVNGGLSDSPSVPNGYANGDKLVFWSDATGKIAIGGNTQYGMWFQSTGSAVAPHSGFHFFTSGTGGSAGSEVLTIRETGDATFTGVINSVTGYQINGSAAATTINGQTCTLGSSCNVNSGAATHSLAINEGAGAAVAGVALGAHQVPVGVASADPVAKTITDCLDTGGNHLNYAQSSDSWSCGTSSSTSYAGSFVTLTDASPIAWNIGSAGVVNATVTLNHTTATRALNISNVVNGGVYVLKIVQDSTGGAAMTFGTGCTWKVGGFGQGVIALSTTANAIDVMSFIYDGTNCLVNFRAAFN